MDRRDALTALQLAEEWNREGLLSDASRQKLEARYAAAADKGSAEPLGTTVLYGLGGVLLGAAVLALFAFLVEEGALDAQSDAVPWMFLGWGALCAGVAFWFDKARHRVDLGDAFHVAALVGITASAFPKAGTLPLWGVAMAYAIAIVYLRRNRAMGSLVALVAFNAAFQAFLWGYLEAEHDVDKLAMTLFLVVTVVQVGVLAWVGRTTPRLPWVGLSLFAATALVAGSSLGYYFGVVDPNVDAFRGAPELVVALVMSLALAAGLALREKGMVIAAAAILAIDAIVFAFDVGALIGGLLALLALAGLLIWKAGSLRKYLRE